MMTVLWVMLCVAVAAGLIELILTLLDEGGKK
jgi:hypothetical protein